MLSKLTTWATGAYLTIFIKYRHPDLYHGLLQTYFPDDFTEVGPPCSA